MNIAARVRAVNVGHKAFWANVMADGNKLTVQVEKKNHIRSKSVHINPVMMKSVLSGRPNKNLDSLLRL